jgi:DNA-binding transcriptional MerR regulator
MPTKLLKAADVCDMTQVQPYVLRSWEKEFPGIGIQKSQESPRLYRQSDVEQVLRIKQLVFVEGLTVAGARRRLEEESPRTSAVSEDEVAEVIEALGAHARERITIVRDGLRSILELLAVAPGAGPVGLSGKPRAAAAIIPAKPSKSRDLKVRSMPARSKASRSKAAPARAKVSSKAVAKRKRANA